MAKFVLIDEDMKNIVDTTEFDDLDKAMTAANGLVSDDPNTTVYVAKLVKAVSSSVAVQVDDIL